MQKAFIAIVLALTLSCVASYTVGTGSGAWVKTPVSIVKDDEWNYTNLNQTMVLGPLTSLTDLNLIGYLFPGEKECGKDSALSCSFDLSYKPIATKDLTSKTNSSYSFKAAQMSSFINGYAISVFEGNDTTTKLPQVGVAQTKLDGNNQLPQIIITSNTKADNVVKKVQETRSGKNVMVIVSYNQTYNFTSFTIGGSSKGKEFTFVTAPNASTTYSIDLAWGEALSSSQAYAGYVDGDSYKVAVLDFGSGTQIGGGSISGYLKTMTCKPYATDKKLYGVWCTNTTVADKDGKVNITVYASSANTTLYQLFVVTNATSGYSISEAFPYSGYLGFFHKNTTDPKVTTVDKQIWDLTTNKPFFNQTNVVTYDDNSEELIKYRIQGAGYYAVLYNQTVGLKATNRTNVQVGQILAGSSLTTVFGFLMTIVAGLFLF